MPLLRLEINHFRNLTAVSTPVGPHINLLYGDNGSGKSSFLEAIHYLGLARSFRTNVQSRIIQHQQPNFSLFGLVEQNDLSIPIGISRDQSGKSEIRIAGQNVSSIIELANILPLQFIDGDAYLLLSGGPKYRRQFLDWGVFHVEHHFFPLWQRFQRALKQRNALLRTEFSHEHMSLWNHELVSTALEINQLRENYISLLKPRFFELVDKFLPQLEISMGYYQGWPDRDLQAVLLESIHKDIELGYTQFGPQKADILFRINKMPLHDALSQGQQKLIVYALRLAQGSLLQQQVKKCNIYLIDDLPSELDTEKQHLLASELSSLSAQVFITGIRKKDLEVLFPKNIRQMFHVEHGVVSAFEQ